MYFNLSESIVDRLDLSIEEKMACVVLARYANNSAFDGLITLSVVAKKMAVDEHRAKQALLSLRAKDLIGDIDLLNDEIMDGSSGAKIAAEEAGRLEAAEFSQLAKESKHAKVEYDELADIFDEIVPKNRLNILYALAGEDISKLKTAYQKVKETHKFDVIDALAEYLQAPEMIEQNIKSKIEAEVEKEATQTDKIQEALDFEEAKALLDILENDVDPEEVIRTGKIINRQINLGKVQNAYTRKK